MNGNVQNPSDSAVVEFAPCAGASPWFVENAVSTRYLTAGSGGTAIRASGDCHPVIEANSEISSGRAVAERGAEMRAIHCAAANGIASRCVITRNPTVFTSEGETATAIVSHSSGGESPLLSGGKLLALGPQRRRRAGERGASRPHQPLSDRDLRPRGRRRAHRLEHRVRGLLGSDPFRGHGLARDRRRARSEQSTASRLWH